MQTQDHWTGHGNKKRKKKHFHTVAIRRHNTQCVNLKSNFHTPTLSNTQKQQWASTAASQWMNFDRSWMKFFENNINQTHTCHPDRTNALNECHKITTLSITFEWIVPTHPLWCARVGLAISMCFPIYSSLNCECKFWKKQLQCT